MEAAPWSWTPQTAALLLASEYAQCYNALGSVGEAGKAMLEVANLILIVMATECLNKDYAEAFHMYIYDKLADLDGLDAS